MPGTTCINCFTINPEGANFCCICGVQLQEIGNPVVTFGNESIDLSSASLKFATGKVNKNIQYIKNPPAVFMFSPLAYYHIDKEFQSEKDMKNGIQEMQDDGWEKVKVDGMKVRFRKVSMYIKNRIG